MEKLASTRGDGGDPMLKLLAAEDDDVAAPKLERTLRPPLHCGLEHVHPALKLTRVVEECEERDDRVVVDVGLDEGWLTALELLVDDVLNLRVDCRVAWYPIPHFDVHRAHQVHELVKHRWESLLQESLDAVRAVTVRQLGVAVVDERRGEVRPALQRTDLINLNGREAADQRCSVRGVGRCEVRREGVCGAWFHQYKLLHTTH